jgi:predicted N-acyltransferase
MLANLAGPNRVVLGIFRKKRDTFMAYRVAFHDSIDQVAPRQWQALQRGASELVMDARFIRAVERSTRDLVGRLSYLVICDEREEAVAGVCLCVCDVDLALLATGGLRTAVAALGRVAPGLTRLRTLFVGLPLAAGRNCLLLAPGAAVQEVLPVLNDHLGEVALRHGARLIVVANLTAEDCRRLEPLEKLGYARAGGWPMNYAPTGFRDFDDFCASLNSRKRYPIQRSRKKFEQSGLRVVHRSGGDGVDRLYTDAVHRLFEAVEEDKARITGVPAAFFRELACQMPRESVFTFIEDGDRVAACATSLWMGGFFQEMFVAFDYELNPRCDLYFNLFFNAVDFAFRHGASEILLGATSDTFKTQKLGACQRPRYHYFKCLRPLGSRLAPRIIKRWFPVAPTNYHGAKEGP